MKKGFTLVELMIVIGIIGILSAILLKSVSGSSESARAVKCLANLHDLANACQATALDDGEHNCPRAGSGEYTSMSMVLGKGFSKTYGETRGWVSWTSMGAYRNSPKQSQYSSSWLISTYEKNQDKRLYALTNGTIWKAIGGNSSSYRCPLHEQCAKKKGESPIWSYVMNEYFMEERNFTSLGNRDRRLLFAELPFNIDNKLQTCSFSRGTGTDLDPTLQYTKNEVIGFNHKTKRKWVAHVCFADGHTEKLEMPGDTSLARLRELTKWLCEGTAISYNGTKYEEVKN